MANHPSAKKRHRQSLKRQERNRHVRATVRNAIRAVRAKATAGEDAAGELATAERLLRKASSKGAFHGKTVSRTISRLTRLAQRPS